MKHQIYNQTVKRKSAVLLAVAAAMAGMMANGGVTATGGTKTMVDGSAYVHTFTESGTFTVTRPGTVEVRVVVPQQV